ncbi:MAG: hypothetical protein WBJ62_07535 [Coriobacteriia bacterium]
MGKTIGRALGASVLVSLIIYMLATAALMFYALGTQQTVAISDAYRVVVEPDLGFYLQFGAGYAIGFGVLVVAFTAALAVMWHRSAPRPTAS